MLIPTRFKKSTIALTTLTTLAFSPMTNSAGSGGIVSEDTSSMYSAGKKATYSPYAQRNFPDRPLWGDTHLHTAISFDAGTFGASLLPADLIFLPKVKK